MSSFTEAELRYLTVGPPAGPHRHGGRRRHPARRADGLVVQRRARQHRRRRPQPRTDQEVPGCRPHRTGSGGHRRRRGAVAAAFRRGPGPGGSDRPTCPVDPHPSRPSGVLGPRSRARRPALQRTSLMTHRASNLVAAAERAPQRRRNPCRVLPQPHRLHVPRPRRHAAPRRCAWRPIRTQWRAVSGLGLFGAARPRRRVHRHRAGDRSRSRDSV